MQQVLLQALGRRLRGSQLQLAQVACHGMPLLRLVVLPIGEVLLDGVSRPTTLCLGSLVICSGSVCELERGTATPHSRNALQPLHCRCSNTAAHTCFCVILVIKELHFI